jgi:uncharacterized flavoprotein (TIGR03862 family)
MVDPSLPRVAVIGAGPAGLMAAEVLGAAGLPVTVYERMPSVGRKFLMAGRGGLNLTHSEEFEHLLTRYGAAQERLRPVLEAFSPADLRIWCEGLGEETFVGSSGRVFPKSFKASPLLRAWLRRLDSLGVHVAVRHRWTALEPDGSLRFQREDGTRVQVRPDATVLALGGASWPRLGSDGSWAALLEQRGIPVSRLRPANAGFTTVWSDPFRGRFEGEPLKRIALCFGDAVVRGEAVVTADGIEGGAVYALSAPLRDAIERDGSATLYIDLRPDLTVEALARRVAAPRKRQSTSTFLRKAAGLPPLAIALLREGTGNRIPDDPAELARAIKAVRLRLTGVKGLERAISTAGGVPFEALDRNLMLRDLPGIFVAGEMLDWEAPTGGYLLTACWATGRWAGQAAARRLR